MSHRTALWFFRPLGPFIAWGFAIALHAPAAVAQTGPIAAQPFVPVSSPQTIDAEWRSNICALLPQPCEDKSVQLYRTKGASPSSPAFVVIASLPLAMANVERINNQWRLDKLYDFRGYQHSQANKEGRQSAYPTIAPALYPLGPNRWAAAVLSTTTESYSGGGASFSTADFVPLDGLPAAKSAVAHAGIPFACQRMIRACFSEKEYATSPHCHDETEGALRIAYGIGPHPQAPYRWEYLWSETEWPAFTKQNRTTKTTSRFTDESPEAPFCGGPQE